MANTPKTSKNTVITDDADTDHIDVLTPEEREEEDTEAVIAAEFGKGDRDVTWSVKVWRSAAKGEPEPYLFTCSPSELPIIDRLRDEYGTGTYRIRVFKNNRVFRYFTVPVEARRAPAVPVAAPVAASDGLAAALERQTALLERLINQRPQPVQQTNQIELLSTLLGAISQVKSLFGPPPSSAPENAIDLFMKGIEAAQTLGGGGKGETGFMDILRDVIKSPLVEKVLESVAAGVPATQPMITRQPGIGEAPQPIVSPQQPPQQPPQQEPPTNGEPIHQQSPTPESDPRLIAMVHNIRYLATKAAANADVELYADWVLDNVPRDLLAQMIEDPQALTTLSNAVPEARPYMGWFGQLLTLVNDALTEDASEVQDMGHVQPRSTVNTNEPAGGSGGHT